MIEYAGRPAVLSVVRHITEHKQMEKERANLEKHLVQVRKMEALGQLAGSVAHDCSNLLFVINGRAELILSRLGPHDPMRKELEAIHRSSARAADLVHKLLASSRKEP
jgi:signal transduction histidine kinase